MQPLPSLCCASSTAAVQTGLYNKNCAEFGLEVIDLPEDIQAEVHASIFDFKYNGVTQKNVDMMRGGIDYLVEKGVDALLMGCTEIPIILKGQECPLPLIDPNDIIAKVAVAYAKNEYTL